MNNYPVSHRVLPYEWQPRTLTLREVVFLVLVACSTSNYLVTDAINKAPDDLPFLEWKNQTLNLKRAGSGRTKWYLGSHNFNMADSCFELGFNERLHGVP